MDTTQTQGIALLLFVYLGAALGVVYDALRLLRLVFDKRWVTAVLDTVFCIAFLLGMCFAYYPVTGGAVRIYGILVAACGFWLQQWAFGLPICKRIVKRFDRLSFRR